MNDTLLSRHSAILVGLVTGAGLLTSSMMISTSANAGPAFDEAPMDLPVEPLPEPEPEGAAAVCDPAMATFSMGCEIDMTHPTNPLWPCAVPGVTVQSYNGSGLTIRVDMDAAPLQYVPSGQWDILEVVGMTSGLSAYALDIGNSPSNNGWTGDSGHSSYDAEAHVYNDTLNVWHGDMAGSGMALQVGNSVSSSGGFFEATVCDGSFTWESDTTSPTTVMHGDSIFQLRQPGDADGQYYYVAFNQVVHGSYRSGSGIDPYPYLILSAL